MKVKEKTIGVRKNQDMKLDKSGFFVIHADHRGKRIIVEHYGYDRKMKNKLVGKSAKDLCNALVKKGVVLDLNHAAYLGRELMKAEIAVRGELKYKQDSNILLD